MDRAEARERAASDACLTWLDDNSPRPGWRYGVPCSWLVSSLTFELAMSTGELPVIPLAFGQTERDSASFRAGFAVAS